MNPDSEVFEMITSSGEFLCCARLDLDWRDFSDENAQGIPTLVRFSDIFGCDLGFCRIFPEIFPIRSDRRSQ
jgi:hypothetical protein